MAANLPRRVKATSAGNISEKLPSFIGKIASWSRSFHDSKEKELVSDQCRGPYTQNANICRKGSLYPEDYGGMMGHEQSNGSSSDSSLVASSISSKSLGFHIVDDDAQDERVIVAKAENDRKEDNNSNGSSWTPVAYLKTIKLKITKELNLRDGTVPMFTVATARRSNREDPSNDTINTSFNGISSKGQGQSCSGIGGATTTLFPNVPLRLLPPTPCKDPIDQMSTSVSVVDEGSVESGSRATNTF